MAMDRKRRLTASSQEHGRRRTTTGGFTSRDNRFYHTPPRHNSHNPTSPGHGSDPDQNEIIDLTGSSPPAPTQANIPIRPNPPQSDSSRSYVVPRWQPDAEVSECPICRRPFGFLFRRHHCRKCGRVVCNDCSPHRITIPRQYIVHPPGEEGDPLFGVNAVDLTRDDDDNIGQNSFQSRMNQALGGGEKVRLCNPCVPDPQPELQSMFNQANSRPLPPAPPHRHSHLPARSPPSAFTRYPPQILPPARSFDSREQPLPHLPHPGSRVHIDTDDDDDDDLGSSSEAYHNPENRRGVVSRASIPKISCMLTIPGGSYSTKISIISAFSFSLSFSRCESCTTSTSAFRKPTSHAVYARGLPPILCESSTKSSSSTSNALRSAIEFFVNGPSTSSTSNTRRRYVSRLSRHAPTKRTRRR